MKGRCVRRALILIESAYAKPAAPGAAVVSQRRLFSGNAQRCSTEDGRGGGSGGSSGGTGGSGDAQRPVSGPNDPRPGRQPRGSGDGSSDPSSSSRGGGGRGSALLRYGRDLTADARRGLLDPLLGREDVLRRALQVLLRRNKNNVVLVGDAGVGKTAVAEGIAQMMVSPQAPPGLQGRRLVSLDVGSLVAGTQYRGSFEERLQGVLADVRAARGQVVLFIDEIHMLVGAGQVEGGLDAANLLKPALARGELHCIGATTLQEYKKHVEGDAALARRFQPVLVDEPTVEEAARWLTGLAPRYERYHGVRYTPGALRSAAAAAHRYITDRRLPDSAIDVMDEAGARKRLKPLLRDMFGASSTTAATTTMSDHHDPAARSPSVGDTAGVAQQPGSLASQTLTLNRQQQRDVLGPPGLAPETVLGGGSGGSFGSDGGGAGSSGGGGGGGGSTSSGGSSGGSGTWRGGGAYGGRAEAEARELLEWFGAAPDRPVAGQQGHRAMTEARRRKYLELWGPGEYTRHPDDAITGDNAATPGPGPASAFGADYNNPAGLQQRQQQQQPPGGSGGAIGRPGGGGWRPGVAVPGDGGGGGGGGGAWSAASSVVAEYYDHRHPPRPCPHCGFPVLHVEGAMRIQCPRCWTTFLNIAPEKLMLGATVATRPSVRPYVEEALLAPPPPAATPVAAVAVAVAVAGPMETPAGVGSSAMPGTGPISGLPAPDMSYGTAAAPAAGGGGGGGGGGPAPLTQAGQQQQQVQRHTYGAAAAAAAAAHHDVPVVDEDDIMEVVATSSGVPAGALAASERESLMALEERLARHVVGQGPAVRALSAAVRLGRLGLHAKERPVGAFLLVGPPGCGKTTLAKAVALEVFGDERALVTVNGREFSERSSVARLIGAPPGYVGYGTPGMLSDAMSRHPHCCVVVEDADRAHTEVLQLLAQVLDDGMLSDSSGKRVNFRNAILLLTVTDVALPSRPSTTYTTGAAAAATAAAQQPAAEGQGASVDESPPPIAARPPTEGDAHGGAAAATADASSSSSGRSLGGAPAAAGAQQRYGMRAMPHDVVGRLDEVIVLRALGPESAAELTRLALDRVARDVLSQHSVRLEVDPGAEAWLEARALDPARGGARALEGLVRHHVMSPLADAMLRADAGLLAGVAGGSGTQGVIARVRLAAEAAAAAGDGSGGALEGGDNLGTPFVCELVDVNAVSVEA